MDTGCFVLSKNVIGVVIDRILPNFYLGTKRFIGDFSPRNGLILSAKSYIKTLDTFDQNSSFTFLLQILNTKKYSFGYVLMVKIIYIKWH